MIRIGGLVVRTDRQGVSPLDRHGVTERDRHRPAALACTSTTTDVNTDRSIEMYSMYEAFARERMRERREQALAQRLSSELAAGRLWRWLAAFSARQAARSERRLAAQAAGYQLAG